MPSAQQQHGLIIPVCEIYIDGSALSSQASTRIRSVTVDDSLDLPGMFAVEFINSDAASGPLIEDQAEFDVGKAVEVRMGYHGQLTSLMIGEITGLEGDYTSGGLPRLTVRGYDRRHRLQRGRKVRTFVKQKDSQIASTIAGEAGLSAVVTESKVVHDYVIQANQTDMEFLLERARRIRYQLTARDKQLVFKPAANAESPILTLTWRDGLLEFHPRLTSVGQVSEVKVQGWDPKTKARIVGSAPSATVSSKMGGDKSGPEVAAGAFNAAVGLVSDIPVAVQAEADQDATSFLNASSLAFISGEGSCVGRGDMLAGKVIRIDGLGKRFSGFYYITSVSHRLGSSGYATHFTVRRNAT